MTQSLIGGWIKVKRSLGIVGMLFILALVLAFTGISVVATVSQMLVVILGIWLCVRWLKFLTRKAIWRLRNRLLVTYLFIAVVPLSLIVILSRAITPSLTWLFILGSFLGSVRDRTSTIFRTSSVGSWRSRRGLPLLGRILRPIK